MSCLIDTLFRFISKCFKKVDVYLEKVIGRNQDKSPSFSRILKTSADSRTCLFLRLFLEVMKLIEATDHAYTMADPFFRCGEVEESPLHGLDEGHFSLLYHHLIQILTALTRTPSAV